MLGTGIDGAGHVCLLKFLRQHTFERAKRLVKAGVRIPQQAGKDLFRALIVIIHRDDPYCSNIHLASARRLWQVKRMTPRPILIVGSGRSGTSVLTWAIGQHPNVIITPETNWLAALASNLDGLYRIGKLGGHIPSFEIGFDAFAEGMGIGADRLVRDSYFRRFPNRKDTQRKPGKGLEWFRGKDEPKQRWVDGTPANTGYAMLLAKMFPNAVFINLVRDPKDVFRSWAGFSSRAPEHADPVELLAHIYHSQRAGYLVEAAMPDRTLRVLFADMIANPGRELRRVSVFIGEEFTPAMVEPIEGGKVNSSGETKPKAEEELASVADHSLMVALMQWFDQAHNEAWRIASAPDAADAMAMYSAHKIPL